MPMPVAFQACAHVAATRSASAAEIAGRVGAERVERPRRSARAAMRMPRTEKEPEGDPAALFPLVRGEPVSAAAPAISAKRGVHRQRVVNELGRRDLEHDPRRDDPARQEAPGARLRALPRRARCGAVCRRALRHSRIGRSFETASQMPGTSSSVPGQNRSGRAAGCMPGRPRMAFGGADELLAEVDADSFLHEVALRRDLHGDVPGDGHDQNRLRPTQ